jgi:hypothetical protein
LRFSSPSDLIVFATKRTLRHPAAPRRETEEIFFIPQFSRNIFHSITHSLHGISRFSPFIALLGIFEPPATLESQGRPRDRPADAGTRERPFLFAPEGEKSEMSQETRATGPTTEAGKETVSANAVKHGLSATKHAILPSERAEFEKFLEEFLAHHKPVGPEEHRLAVSVAENAWRVRRAHRMEAALFDQAIAEKEEGLDNAFAQAKAWIDPPKGLQRIGLYAARIQRTIDRDSARLEALQSARKAAYAKAQEEAILLCKLNYSTGHKFNPADHFAPNGDFGGFVFSDRELAQVITRQNRLDQARARFDAPPRSASADAASLRALEALIG